MVPDSAERQLKLADVISEVLTFLSTRASEYIMDTITGIQNAVASYGDYLRDPMRHRESLTHLSDLGALSFPTADLVELGRRLVELSPTLPSNLIPLRNMETEQSLRAYFPEDTLCVCDFPVEGAENWERMTGGFRSPDGTIENVGHHSPHSDMKRHISSGNLAAARVRAYGPASAQIVNNHMDCDSVITRLIMGGEIPPLSIFEPAVLAADHTGEEDRIADLLQALDTVDIKSFDPGFGGRWNAGANKRAGGSPLSAEEYASELGARIAQRLAELATSEHIISNLA